MARCARPARLAVRLLRRNPGKRYGKPALVSSLSRLGSLLGGGGSPERTGLVPSMRLLPLVGRPETRGVGAPGRPRPGRRTSAFSKTARYLQAILALEATVFNSASEPASLANRVFPGPIPASERAWLVGFEVVHRSYHDRLVR